MTLASGSDSSQSVLCFCCLARIVLCMTTKNEDTLQLGNPTADSFPEHNLIGVPASHTVLLFADQQCSPLWPLPVQSPLAFAEEYITGWEQDCVVPGDLVPAVDALTAWSDLENAGDALVLVEYAEHVPLPKHYNTTKTVVFAELAADDG